MPRRKLPESTDNHERWLVSYADFITLLFAFFVVMYSTSSTNPERGNFRVLSGSILAAFTNPGQAAQLEAAPRSVEQVLTPLLSEYQLELENESRHLEIVLPSHLLFPSGSRVLLADAVPLLESLAGILSELPNEIRVEAYTDNLPVLTGRFDSNWELSSAQATAVVSELEAQGLNPKRLSATGFGEHRPIADNSTEKGQTANRRVVVVIQTFAGDTDTPTGFALPITGESDG